MSQPRRMKVSLPGLQFTKLEEHLFSALAEAMKVFPYGKIRLRASRSKRSQAHVELHVSFGEKWQTALCQVHGLKPVRYHLQTGNTPVGKALSKLFAIALGDENLNTDSSIRSGRNLSLVYQVQYPEDVVKKLR